MAECFCSDEQYTNATTATYYTTVCKYCGGSCVSPEICPRVKRIRYYDNGAIKSIELRKGPTPVWQPVQTWPWTYPVVPNQPWTVTFGSVTNE